jgi:lactate dehydrogenase-like 2-hydroxyacid dehydrogenase
MPVPTRPRIIATRRFPPVIEAALAAEFDAVLSTDDHAMSAAELQRALGEADGILCAIGDRFTAEVLSAYPIRTRIIASFGVGLDHIDLAAAAAHDITVTNTPDVLTEDTADLALTLILMTMRRAGEGERELRAGRWRGIRPTHLLGRRVSGATLGVVGAGRIGRALARKAHHGLGMRVLLWGRTMPDEATLAAIGAEAVPTLEALLADSQVVSLHVPGTPETHHLIDARRIALMPPHSFLVNTARGTVVDTDALVAALTTGHLAGAGLDVYPHEPEVDRRLLGMEQVVLLPHIGSATVETRTAMGQMALESLRHYFEH